MLSNGDILMSQAKVTGVHDTDDARLSGCWPGSWLSRVLAKEGEEKWTWRWCALEKVSCRCANDASEGVITEVNGAVPAGVGRLGRWKPITGSCDAVVRKGRRT